MFFEGVIINWVLILLAAVVSMAIGFLWYSPYGLGKSWMEVMGWAESEFKQRQKEMGMMYALIAVVALIQAFVVYHLVAFMGAISLLGGLFTGFWLWVGLVMPVQLSNTIYEGKPWKLFIINTSYYLVSLMLMGTLFAYFG